MAAFPLDGPKVTALLQHLSLFPVAPRVAGFHSPGLADTPLTGARAFRLGAVLGLPRLMQLGLLAYCSEP